MEIEVISEKENPLLRRKELCFEVKHDQSGSTPVRLDVRKAIASALKVNVDLVFVRKVETKTGTRTAVGLANIYDSPEQAGLAEPEYVINRNMPPKKPAETQEGKE